jgi:phosphinothricin acetyltransferase
MMIYNKKNSSTGQYDGFVTYLLIGEENVGAKNISIQITNVDVNGEQFLHSHKPEQCYYIIEGKGLMTVDDETKEVVAGDAIYLPSNSRHGIKNITNGPLKYLTANSPCFGKIKEAELWPLKPGTNVGHKSSRGCNMKFVVEKMKDEDWDEVASIYQEGIVTGNATFETDVPTWENWDKSHLRDCRLVAKAEGKVIGWTALSPVSTRCVYSGVAEVSLYVAASTRGVGVGKALLLALIDESERIGIWTLQAGIFPENIASIALTRACGFREVGRRERIGQMDCIWRDVILMERRSNVAGIEKNGELR